MSYVENKLRARTKTTKPTLTDQSAAKETDRNVIVNRYMIHGQAPGSGRPPMFGNFAELPEDLAGFFSQARALKHLKLRLPPQLQKLSQEELLNLNKEQLQAILTPPAPPPAPTEEKK